ncbi:MAG: ArsR family transcriptional regulator [Theionarchaea archaeon]|nr:ArsR family transcriptional regulator [Theionarchaea archaeon]
MSPVNMCGSRHEILKILKRERCTVDELSSKVGISPTAIRQHLTILEGDSLVTRETLKEGIGRPKVIYTITEKAEELFPKFYSWLAECLIEAITGEYGEEKVESLMRQIGIRFSQPYLERVRGKPLEERVCEATDIMNEWGAYASVENDGGDYLLKNYNCSFYKVAQKYPQVCSVHTTFLENLLELNPERIASMAEGNDYCAYQIKGK